MKVLRYYGFLISFCLYWFPLLNSLCLFLLIYPNLYFWCLKVSSLKLLHFIPFNLLLTSSSCMTLNTIYPLVNFKFISPALTSPTYITVIFKWPFNISYASQMISNLGPLPTSPNISLSLQLFHLCDDSGQSFGGIWNLFLRPHLTSNPLTIVYMVQYLKYN